MISKQKTIRDSIHGDIKIKGLFVDLLESPELQRLYNIKQLGLAHLVFPGAHHTRLEHSLGTYYLVSKAAKILKLNKNDTNMILCAALLHDIGHGPFSHTLEYILRNTLNIDHIDLTEKLILGKYDVFNKEEKKFINHLDVYEILEKYHINQKELADLIKSRNNKKIYLNELLNSTVDVDQLDYLIRDAYYTGVAYGVIDIDRYLEMLLIKNNHLAVNRKAVSVVESILLSRVLMYSSVYFHKTVRIAELMLSKAIDTIKSTDSFDFLIMTDMELINNLKNKGEFQNKIITCLKYRKLFKQAYSASLSDLNRDNIAIIKDLENIKKRRKKEIEIENTLKIPQGHIIIDVPHRELFNAEPRIKQTNIKIYDENRIKTIDDFTPIPSAIKSRIIPDWSVMIITHEKYRKIVAENVNNLLFN